MATGVQIQHLVKDLHSACSEKAHSVGLRPGVPQLHTDCCVKAVSARMVETL